VWGKQQVVTCPGRKLQAGPVARREYKWDDADPVSIRLSLLRINDIALAGVSGEGMTVVQEHLKKRVLSRTVMVTHANGSSGCIPDDAAYEQISYGITTTHLKPGCAENKIVSGFVEMMEER
jgi:neutral ceramidase